MELEGSLILEQPPRRRWVSVVAVIVPVVVFVGAAAWFIRAFVAPPMVAVPAQRALAEASPPAQKEVAAPAPAAPQPAAAAKPAAADPAARNPDPTRTLPIFPSLAYLPRSLSVDATSTAPGAPQTAPAAASEAREPFAGPVPLPQPRPRVSVALAEVAVPLPRPRPPQASPAQANPQLPVSDIPAFRRHGGQ